MAYSLSRLGASWSVCNIQNPVNNVKGACNRKAHCAHEHVTVATLSSERFSHNALLVEQAQSANNTPIRA